MTTAHFQSWGLSSEDMWHAIYEKETQVLLSTLCVTNIPQVTSPGHPVVHLKWFKGRYQTFHFQLCGRECWRTDPAPWTHWVGALRLTHPNPKPDAFESELNVADGTDCPLLSSSSLDSSCPLSLSPPFPYTISSVSPLIPRHSDSKKDAHRLPEELLCL